MKNNLKKIMCVLLCASMLASFSACSKKNDGSTDEPTTSPSQSDTNKVSYDTAATSYKKNETVYVNMASDGQVTSKIVTDWLHTDKAQTYIDDMSDLSDIKNVKSNVEPVKNKDGSYRWNMETTDLYYRGSTKKDLPVNFNITYYLDGKQTTAEKIAGKKGQVKMVITVNNESKKTVKIAGKDTTIYTPFIVAGGMILQEDNFSNVTVENGKTIGDGTKEIALMVGAPGLKESLNLSDEMLKQLGDFNFSNTYTITADTEKFELTNMIFAVLPLSAIESSVENNLPNTVSDVKNTLNEVQAVIDKFNSMNATELINKLFSNTDNLTELASSVSDVTKLYNDNKALLDVLEKYMTKENIEAIQKLIEDTDDTDLEQVAKLLNNPILQKFFKQLPTLSKDMETVMPIITGLSTDMQKPEVQKALKNLPQTIETLKKLKTTIDKNQDLFNTLGNTLDDDTIASLKGIMSSLDKIISENDLEAYAKLADNADDLIARAKAWIEAGQKYDIFTTKGAASSTSVMFVYETAAVSAPAEEVKEEAETVEENAILTWFKKLFKKDK
ncbi:MAG TPA: hypothetical protein DCY15_04510 [Ruminococcaceae bacterium]|nr:hypothetical protein [Oscillospiraceae bacterium]